jgi:hypothetical protein
LRCGYRPKRAMTPWATTPWANRGLADPECVLRPQVLRRVAHLLLLVADVPLVEGEVLRGGEGHPEDHALRERRLPVHPRVDPLRGES